MALYLFWGPLVIWGIFVAALILVGSPIRVRVNVMCVAGAVLGIAAVTAGWDFNTNTTLWESSMGLWYFIIAS